MRGSEHQTYDPNLIMDERNPFSSGGIRSAMKLCGAFGIKFKPNRPTRIYRRGWGHELLNAMTVVCSWTLPIQDIKNTHAEFTFDFVDDDYPLNVGLDVSHYSMTKVISEQPTLTLKRPPDVSERQFEIYLTGESSLDRRSRIAIIPSVRALMTNRAGMLRTLVL